MDINKIKEKVLSKTGASYFAVLLLFIDVLYLACALEDDSPNFQSAVKKALHIKEHIGGVAPYYEGHDDKIEPNPHNKLHKEMEREFHSLPSL